MWGEMFTACFVSPQLALDTLGEEEMNRPKVSGGIFSEIGWKLLSTSEHSWWSKCPAQDWYFKCSSQDCKGQFKYDLTLFWGDFQSVWGIFTYFSHLSSRFFGGISDNPPPSAATDTNPIHTLGLNTINVKLVMPIRSTHSLSDPYTRP